MRVRVFKPSISATQSGRANTRAWIIEPEDASARRIEPIMGWNGAEDAFSSLRSRLRFGALEDVLAFAKNKGWDVVVQEPHEKQSRPNSYMNNFRIVRPEDEERLAK